MRLDALFKQPQALPTVPKIVHELIESFNKEDISIEEIARKLAADPVLSARMLRLANSAYYHVSRSIGTVDDAMAMLGFVTVRTLVISSGLTSGFKNMPGLDLARFWRYSLNTAAVARWLAKHVHANGDLAFTVGLMHAIGELVMHAGMPESMLQVDKIAAPTDPRRLDIEHASFGYDFSAVGAELARQWKFPPAFSEAIAGFAHPLDRTPFDTMAAIVHLASWRARAEDNKLNADEIAGTVPMAVCAKLGISHELLLKELPPLAELSAGLEEMIA